MIRFILAASVLSAVSAVAQQSPVSGPVAGFTFDAPTRSIRAVNGSLGSAALGAPLAVNLDFASVAPRKDYAIGCAGDACYAISNLSGKIVFAPLANLAGVADGVVWSRDGSGAVVFSRSGNWMQRIQGIPSAIAVGAPIAVPEGTLSAVALDTTGDQLVFSVSGASTGVFWITGGANVVPIGDAAASVLAFAQDGKSIYAFPEGSGVIEQIELSSGGTQSWVIPDQADTSAARFDRDSSNPSFLYLASRNGHSLTAYDVATRQVVSRASLSFEPTEIEALGNGNYLLHSRVSDDDVLWSFRAAQQPLIYFVPATPLPATNPPARRQGR